MILGFLHQSVEYQLGLLLFEHLWEKPKKIYSNRHSVNPVLPQKKTWSVLWNHGVDPNKNHPVIDHHSSVYQLKYHNRLTSDVGKPAKGSIPGKMDGLVKTLGSGTSFFLRLERRPEPVLTCVTYIWGSLKNSDFPRICTDGLHIVLPNRSTKPRI